MWTATTRIATTASPRALWRLFEDVAGWTNWTALECPFAAGSAIETKPPGRHALRSTLCDVRADAGLGDETVAQDTRFLVSHELHALADGGTRITWAVRVDGPEAATLGPLVTADFPEVLAALKALAEQASATAA